MWVWMRVGCMRERGSSVLSLSKCIGKQLTVCMFPGIFMSSGLSLSLSNPTHRHHCSIADASAPLLLPRLPLARPARSPACPAWARPPLSWANPYPPQRLSPSPRSATSQPSTPCPQPTPEQPSHPAREPWRQCHIHHEATAPMCCVCV